MSGLSLSLLCGFNLIFVEEKKLRIQEYFKGIEKPLLLKMATSLLAFEPSTSINNEWREFVKMWFGTMHLNDNNVKEIWRRCENLEKEHQRISLLSIIASLRLFEFIIGLEDCVADSKLDDKTANANLFRAYLIFVDEVNSNENNNRGANQKYLESKEDDIKAPLTILNQNYPHCDLQNFDLTEIFFCQLTKSYYLFKFLKSREETTELVRQFYQVFGISSVKEYFEHLILIFNSYVNRHIEGWIEFQVPKDDNYERNCKFLEAISLQNFDKELNADFKLLRGNPIYKVFEGRYSVISSLFTTEKIFKGLYFKLREINDTLSDKGKVKNFRSFYTTNFSENYLLYEVMKYIYGTRSYIQFSGEFLASNKIEGSPDYYIRSGNDLFLFENKDIFINAEIKQSGNLELIENEFLKKLYYNDKGTRIDQKAVIQIANNVRRALLRSNKFDDKYKAKNINIYPILILHDSSFNAVGLNYLVNYWFQIEIEKMKSEGINVEKVRPLSIINIDTLILYSDYLKQKKSTLDELLDAYEKKSIVNYNKQYKSFEHFKTVYGSTLLPFSYFIEHYTNRGFTRASQAFKNLLFNSLVNEIDK